MNVCVERTDIHSGIEPEKETPGAVVLGGAHGSLAIARSLGRHGIPVCFITNDHPLATYSRYVTRYFAWAGPDHEGAVDYLVHLARRHQFDGWVLF